INQGGFLASLTLVVAIGFVLDWRTPGGGSAYPASAFRWAMSVQYVLWALGAVQIWRYRRRARALALREQAGIAERDELGTEDLGTEDLGTDELGTDGGATAHQRGLSPTSGRGPSWRRGGR
ncbi:MAG: transporter, partial [Marmoricola sp.]|nr:transporter [Marmoricola sp.]